MILRRRAGFSLIELLVVVAIVAVLAALLMPAVKMVQNAARASVCAGNLRQCLTGIHLYIAENDGVLPPARVDRPNVYYVNDRANWADVNFVGQYLGTDHAGKAIDNSFGYKGSLNVGKGYVLRCPSDPRPNEPGGIGYGWTMSYGANLSYMPTFWGAAAWTTASLSTISKHGSRGLLSDCTGAQWQITGTPTYLAYTVERDLMAKTSPATWVDRHQGVHVGFMDGRAQKFADPIPAAEKPRSEILLVRNDPGNSLAWE